VFVVSLTVSSSSSRQYSDCLSLALLSADLHISGKTRQRSVSPDRSRP